MSLSSPLGLLQAILVRIPMLLKITLWHGIRLSPVAGKQDLRTELTVAVIRSFMNFMIPVSKQQKGSMRDPGIKGPIWVSKVTLPAPGEDVCNAVRKAFEDLQSGGETFEPPGVGPVEAEWTGYRSGVDKNEPLPDIPEDAKFDALRAEAPSDSVILYFHGGAYFLMDPCTHRVPVAQLSKRTGAPVLSVRYRLAPQHPFPAALVDALVAYLSLIAPPPGSFHAPVPAKKIILAGDSAGGNLSLVLLQTLLTLRRVCPTVHFHGQAIPIEIPGGVATISPWCDIMRCLPSSTLNAHFDYLPVPAQSPESIFRPLPIPADDVWPCKPPRVDFFVNANAVLHPLVSPLTAPPERWAGAPPVFMSFGEEGLTDEALVLARRMHSVGVPVTVEQFEGMPHCFALLMIKTAAGKRFYDGMADFCRQAVAGTVRPMDTLTYIAYKLRSERSIPWEEAVTLTDAEVDELLQQGAHSRVRGEMELQKEWRERAKL
ncbi:putative lipase/esterase [Aspergillus candidus]|uniref:Putative lipase/esterase n=1 Tax=Aspergillus candidus TaxID=41067 RepID=A0A2I2F617_ASPCN|nr:putative lipase/esterase [Aspergillus candidus]PLB36061.1 putative lipase/esterase [Aspergillus candidus]